ncbi:MAG: hypothetical protein NTZ17_15520 [Phycisphaerae bacterium]|nr:hypothetical protein [Phycisphaerae bacterium]
MGGLRRLRRSGAGKYAVEPLRGDPDRQSGKLSAVILDFSRPLIDNVDDDEFETAVTLAVLCWNLALLPEDEQERERRSAVQKLAKGKPAGFASEMEAWTRMLLDRKKTLFGRDRRMVASYRVIDEKDGFHLYVASTLVPPSPATGA